MNIYFIRHGDPDYVTDTLTELGVKQAKILAEAIKDWKVDEVYQSTMGRAIETASFSVKNWNLTPITTEMIKEVCWGDTNGDAYASSSPWVINDEFINNDHQYPLGKDWENHPKIKNDRIVQDLNTHIQQFDDFMAKQGYKREGQLYNAENPNEKEVVFFCHGGVTSALVAHVLNIPFSQMIAHTGLKHTSITKLNFSCNKGYCAGILEYFNDVHHLSGH